MAAAPPSRTSGRASRGGRGADALDPATHALREFFRGRTDVRLAVVFGSRARGTAVEASNVDVAVHAPGALSRVTGHDVDVVALDDVGVPLLARIVREAMGVHEARPGALATWRSHALADLETNRPWFARMRDAWLARVAARGV